MLLFDLLAEAAARFPDKTAVVLPEARITFSVLVARARQVAARLAKLGVGKGARVASMHESSIGALVGFWGTLAAGAETVDIPAHAGASTLAEVLNECKPAALIIDPRQLERISAEHRAALPKIVVGYRALETPARALGLEPQLFEEIFETEKPEPPKLDARPDDVAMIVYTSGTTGRPKGVMLSHQNLISNITAANALTGLRSDDSVLVIVPLYFIHGRMQLLTYAMVGGTVYFSAGLQFPKQVIRELIDYGTSWFSGVPYHFTTLLDRTHLKGTEIPALKHVLITGGALPPPALRRLAAALPGVGLHVAYGATEASPRITYLGPDEVLARPECAGRPLPGILVEIIGSDGMPLPQGAIGEVVCRGPNVMKGYVSGDHISSGRIDDRGRLRTGDLGRLDAEGRLYLFGRKSDMIKTAGERVFPGEIEEVLNKHTGVRESAVLGVRDDSLGERIVALVVPRQGSTPDFANLRSHCLRWLPFVRTPKEVHFVPELPKTASQKINRAALPQMLETIRRG